MEETQKNKMAEAPMKKLLLKMGLPMIISMVLQALYNVIDSIFVANMGEQGAIANQALTLAFPIQILIIAIGVGTGIGLNALLSKSLGEKNQDKVNKVAGNGIFLSICIFIVFLLFGLFGSKWFISLFAGENQEVISMGTTYLKICTCLSLGSIGYTVYERFLQATGKTMLSTISQISGAVTNIILDYIFIFPLGMGVAGAAWATVIGQFVSLFIAMFFHYTKNKEISGNLKYIKPKIGIIKGIYKIGISAAIMQALLSVMMAGMNAILGGAKADPTILVGSFGIYYKIQQIALFSAFVLSNTIISILSFNYGMKDKDRINDCIKYGIIDTAMVTFILTVIFEIFAKPLSSLFALSGGTSREIIEVCTISLRIASIGYIFMGFSVAVQGILQSLGYAIRPLIISLLRLVVFVFPIAYLFTLSNNVTSIVWWSFPIAEILTSIISVFILKRTYKEIIVEMDSKINEILNKKEISYDLEIIKNKIQNAEAKKEKYIMLRNSIKEDLKENFISEEEYWQYNKEYSDKIKKLKEDIQLYEKEKETETIKNNNTDLMNIFKKKEKINELNRLLIDELIEDIVVSEDGNIKVIFKYEDKYFEALDFINKPKYDIILSS